MASVLQSHRVTVGLNELVYRKPSCPSSQRHVLGLVLLFSSMHATSLTSISPFNVTDDISRVKLSVQTHSTDDYVNANYMPVSGQMTRSTGLLQQKRQGAPFWFVLTPSMYFLSLGLSFQERFYCHTRTFTQHFEGFLAYGLGEKCLCHCYVDQMC